MLRLPLLITLLLLSGTFTAQVSPAAFEFEGLRRSQEDYLKRYLSFLLQEAHESALWGGGIDSTGAMYISAAKLDYLSRELSNLPQINKAEVSTIIRDGDTIPRFQITEAQTLFPIVNFGGIRGNFHFQVGFNDINWRGRGQQLSVAYQNSDKQHNFNVFLRNPSINNSRWGYTVGIRRFAAIEPLYFPTAAVNYRYVNHSLGVSGTYQLGHRRLLEVGADLFQEHYRKQDPDIESPGPDDVRQKKLLLKATHTIDRRDFGRQISGFINESYFQTVRNFAEKDWFFIFWNDLRFFRPSGLNGTLAGRLRTGISTNNNSPFAPFVLDSQVNIRGSGNRIDRGTAQLILNLEYRHTVWRDRQQRFSAEVVGFSDLGTWRNPGGEFRDIFDRENFRHFVGGGVRLVYNRAHNAVIRLDYGVDIYNTRERGIVAGFGQYF